MSELSRENHRERVRDSYLKNSFDSMSDSSVLEMLLFYSIPRKDATPIAYELINRFGSLEAVFNADIKELVKVEGVGENTAILINLFHNIGIRIDKNKNKKIKKLDTSEKSTEFVSNELSGLTKERVLVITLDNSLNVIAVNDVSLGSSSSASVEPYKILECVFKDSAANIILAHNHPSGGNRPSSADVNFTLEIINLCRMVKTKVNDHIIVGSNGAFSMASDIEYAMFFENKPKTYNLQHNN